MKPYLPLSILLVLTVLVMGLTALYNFTVRESHAATLQYRYPAVEQPPEEQPALPQLEGFGTEHDEPEPEEPGESTVAVRFPLDVNTATAEELKFIPQVGDVLSQRIVQYREVLGGYTDLEQLRDIAGVGEKTYQHLYAYLIIAEPEAEEADRQNDAG